MKSQSRSQPTGAAGPASAVSAVSAAVALEGPSTGACTDILQEAGRAPGIASVVLDTQHPTLSFDYDPRVIDESRVARIAQEAAPQIEQRLETCTLRLGRKGGRARESCAAIVDWSPDGDELVALVTPDESDEKGKRNLVKINVLPALEDSSTGR